MLALIKRLWHLGRSLRLVGVLGVLALLAVSSAVSVARSSGAATLVTEILPDLRTQAPRGLVVSTAVIDGASHFALGFTSHADNVGEGALVVRGSRASTAVPEMQADQVVTLSDGTTRTYPAVGALHYQQSEDHSHWHLLRFMTYELRRTDTYALVAPDEKTGFCLGDRYDIATYDPTVKPKTKPPAAVFTDYCGKFEPNLLSVLEGISPGYGDRYEAVLEGQSVDVTNVPAGYYYLVHRVNQNRRLHERNTANNASSVQIQLLRPNGTFRAPTFQVLSSCTNGDHCLADLGLHATVPGTLSSVAKRLVTNITVLRTATVALVMRGKRGVVLSWRSRLKAGTTAVSITLPARARQPGSYSLAFTGVSAGTTTVTRRAPLRIHA